MAVYIGQASQDERGKYSGGAAGNQSGRELNKRTWYSYPWNVVLRAKNSTVGNKIAVAMEQAIANKNIGYDQAQRTTLYTAAKAVNFNLSKITTPCETDCSALVAVCVNAAGVTVSPYLYTGNEQAVLMATGQFEALTASRYLTSSSYLRRGDILLNTVHHTAVVLNDGPYAEKTATSENSSEVQTKYFSSPKTYKNGSTDEICYADTDLTVKTGSLNPWESCQCLGIVNGRYLVVYRVDESQAYKTGFVAYSGWVSV